MRRVLVTLAVLLLAPLPALAQRGGSKSVQALVKEGEKLYGARKYREAAEVLKKANEAAPHPRLIYNIARAHDQAGDLQEAMSFYQQYVGSQEGTDPLLLKRASISIDRLRLQLEKETAVAAAAEAERKRLEEEAEAARARADAEAEAARRAEELNRQQQQADYERELANHHRSQVTAFALGGTALAGVGVGVLFGLQASGSVSSFNAALTLDDKAAARDSARTSAVVADIGYAVGLAAAVTAVILYPKGGPPPAPGTAKVTLAPRGVGAGLEVSF